VRTRICGAEEGREGSWLGREGEGRGGQAPKAIAPVELKLLPQPSANAAKEQTRQKDKPNAKCREVQVSENGTQEEGRSVGKGQGRQGVARGGEESDPPTPPAGNRSISSIAKELCLWRASYYLCLHGRPTRRRTWFGEPVSSNMAHQSLLCYTRQALAFCLPTPPCTRRAASTECVRSVCHAPTHAKGGHKQAHGRGGLPFVVLGFLRLSNMW